MTKANEHNGQWFGQKGHNIDIVINLDTGGCKILKYILSISAHERGCKNRDVGRILSA